jgi:Iron-dependent Transcriptional regulator
MMSKKCKYALKALIRLSKEYGGGNLLTDDIAQSEHIPKKFLELILLDLKRAGYVRSKQGTKGGIVWFKIPARLPWQRSIGCLMAPSRWCLAYRRSFTRNAMTAQTKGRVASSQYSLKFAKRLMNY